MNLEQSAQKTGNPNVRIYGEVGAKELLERRGLVAALRFTSQQQEPIEEIIIGVDHGNAASYLESMYSDVDFSRAEEGFLTTDKKFLSREEAQVYSTERGLLKEDSKRKPNTKLDTRHLE
jgi:hypothetical protein